MVGLLELGRWDIAERLEQAVAVIPRDPLEGRELDVLEPLPWPATMDLLGLEQPDDGLGQCVVVRISPASHRGLDTGLGQTFRVPDREILPPAIAVMYQRFGPGGATVVQRLLQRIERQ